MTLFLALLKTKYCKHFEELMKSEFEMSMMGELTFFLGLQVKQTSDGTFIINQNMTLTSFQNINSRTLLL